MPESSNPIKPVSKASDITDISSEFEFEPMSPKELAPPNYGLRIRVLIGVIGVAFATYTFGWFWFAGVIEDRVRAASVENAMACSDLETKGFPFRIGVFCSKASLTLGSPAMPTLVEVIKFRSAAQIYEPTRLIMEIGSPATVTWPNGFKTELTSTLLQTSVRLDGALPSRISVSIESPVGVETGLTTSPLGQAAKVELHMRKGQNNQIDLAADFAEIKIKDATIFNMAADVAVSGVTRFEAAIESKRPLVDVLRGTDGQARNLNLTFVDGGSLSISGPFSISESGLLSATLTVEAKDANLLIEKFGQLGKALGLGLNNLGTLKSMAITPDIKLIITIKDGNASIGFVPLGQIPPL